MTSDDDDQPMPDLHEEPGRKKAKLSVAERRQQLAIRRRHELAEVTATAVVEALKAHNLLPSASPPLPGDPGILPPKHVPRVTLP